MRRPLRFSWLSALSIGAALGLLMAALTIAADVLGWPVASEDGHRTVAVFARHVAAHRERELTSFAIFEEWRRRTTSFDRLSGYRAATVNLLGEPAPMTLRAAEVTPDFFEALNTRLVLGRGFGATPQASGPLQECVISDALWRTRFSASPSVLGSVVRLDVVSGMAPPGLYTIVGVAPSTLRYPLRVNVWLPFSPPEFFRTNRSGQWFGVAGRLRSNLSIEHARAEMDAIMAAVQVEEPRAQPRHEANLVPILEVLTGQYRPLVIGLTLTAGVLLLVVLASTGGLLAALALKEQHHDTIRLSLGARPSGLMGRACRDGLVLGFAGFLIAVPVALVSLQVLGAFSAELFELPLPNRIDAFSAVAGLSSALLLSSLLAVLVKAHALRQTHRVGSSTTNRLGLGGGRATARLRAVLVVAEIALTVVLLAAASDLLSRVSAIREVDLGFETDRVLTVRLALPSTRYGGSRASQFYDALMERVWTMPTVTGVAASSDDPLFGVSANPEFTLEFENRILTPEERSPVLVNGVTDAYFDVLGLRVTDGVTPGREPANALSAVINETFVKQLFPHERPLGRRFRVGGRNQPWWTIVAVVADTRNDGPIAPPKPTAYLRYPAFGKADMTLLVKADNVDALIPGIRAIVGELDRDLPLGRVATASDLVEGRFAGVRIGATVMVVLAIASLVLSTLGLYAVLTALFADMRSEIGLRVALGATPRDLFALVLTKTVTLVGAGLVVGMACASAVGLALRTVVPIGFPEPARVLVLVGSIAAVALLAIAEPAWRAVRISPTETLRAE